MKVRSLPIDGTVCKEETAASQVKNLAHTLLINGNSIYHDIYPHKAFFSQTASGSVSNKNISQS